jgi:phage terminase large subunit GpA-like protein
MLSDPAKTAKLWAALRAGLQPDPRLTVSEWADRHRILDQSSAEPGPWRTSRAPYAREPMDVLGDDVHADVVLMWASQLGKSECLLNWMGWTVAASPCPILLVQPTVDDGEAFSKQRVAPMIDGCAALSKLIAPSRSRDSGNTLNLKEFPGGALRIVGSNAPSKLKSTPIRRVALDEVDTYPADTGGEGDPIRLAQMRTSTFGESRKMVLTSTPTLEGISRIERAYLASDRRQYWVPCPHCAQAQVLQWTATPDHPGGLVWPRGEPEKAAYQCAHCGTLIDESHKAAMLAGGQWRPSAQSTVAGFHLSALYSPPGWITWAALASEWTAATGNPEELKVFVNSRLAETWKLGDATGVQVGTLRARAERYRADVPPGVEVLTAGVDVQDDRIEVEVVGWGAGEESWSIASLCLSGDPSGPLVWRDLAAALDRQFADEHGTQHRIAAAAIDTGGHHTQAVYDFCASRSRAAVATWAIKGRAGPLPAWPAKVSRGGKNKQPLHVVGVDTIKDTVYGRLRIVAAGPGYCHFPLHYSGAYFDQLTAERIVTTRYRGRTRRQWVLPAGKRNEALDCRVYATAALAGLSKMGHRRAKAVQASEMMRQTVAPLVNEQPAIAVAPSLLPPHTVDAPAQRQRTRRPSIWADYRFRV